VRGRVLVFGPMLGTTTFTYSLPSVPSTMGWGTSLFGGADRRHLVQEVVVDELSGGGAVPEIIDRSRPQPCGSRCSARSASGSRRVDMWT